MCIQWIKAIAAITLSAAMSLSFAQTKTLRFGHLHSAESPVHRGIAKAGEEFEKNSAGRFKLAIFPSSQLGAAREMVSQAIDGQLDFVIEGPASLSNINRALSIFEAPFIARDWSHVLKMLDSPYGREQFAKVANDRNLVHVGTFYYGVRHFTTSAKPLNSASDLKGMKIRVPEAPLFLAMIRALEATPTPMSLGEVYLSLQTGVTEGQENPLPTINNNKFFEVQKFVNLTGHVIVPLCVMINRKAWEALSPADQAALKSAFLEGAKVNDELTRADESRLLEFFKTKGVTVVQSDRSSFQSKMGPVYQIGEKDWGKGTFESMQAIR